MLNCALYIAHRATIMLILAICMTHGAIFFYVALFLRFLLSSCSSAPRPFLRDKEGQKGNWWRWRRQRNPSPVKHWRQRGWSGEDIKNKGRYPISEIILHLNCASSQLLTSLLLLCFLCSLGSQSHQCHQHWTNIKGHKTRIPGGEGLWHRRGPKHAG